MTRNTIDFGIDLGTTNSEIAIIDGTRTEIIKNNLNMDYTPSAVYIDKSKRIHVGQRAKDRAYFEDEDAYMEFKRDMGTDRLRTFKMTGVVMKPEELSAEVLKSLKADVAKRLNGEIFKTAVITVPADFEMPQNEATKRAAQLAGLENCHLLQEPIAAALAYGFQSPSDKVFWMVYDFGGGTFDAAIIQLRDGLFRVIYHKGDNFLGGKDLDWQIVEKIIVPEVIKQHKFENFTRKNEDWKSSFAKMKLAAESAKIQLSVDETSLLIIDDLVKEKSIDFEMEIHRKDVAVLAEPLILKSIRICKEVLQEANLSPRDIEKLILVGGPTLSPYHRDLLTDSIEGLGIPLEYSVDPLTVVARGAAIYAGGQLLEQTESTTFENGLYQLLLEYQPIGSDTEPTIGGKIIGEDIQDYSGYSIEISAVNYNSGRIPLGKNGSFITSVLAEPHKKNQYQVNLFDETGMSIQINPNTFSYTIGNAPSDPPLTHNIGVALSNNEVEWFMKKGQPLPGRGMKCLRTTFEVKKGESGQLINIPIIEGENHVADLNRLIGRLQIDGTSIKRDVPAGSEIEVTLNIDKSRIVIVSAYVPLLDMEVPAVKLDLELKSPDLKELNKDLKIQQKKIQELREKADQIDEVSIDEKIQDIETEKSIESIEESIDGKEAVEAEKHLLELKKKLAEIESELEWPSLVEQAENEISLTLEFAEEKEDHKLKSEARTLEREIREAIHGKDPYALRQKTSELSKLRMDAMADDPKFWVGFFYYLLKENERDFTNPSRASELITEGERAIQNGNLDRLKYVVVGLLNLLPVSKQQEITRGYGSTVNH